MFDSPHAFEPLLNSEQAAEQRYSVLNHSCPQPDRR